MSRQWWQPEEKDKEEETRGPATLPTQKVTLGTLLKVEEALWGDGGMWLPSLATEGEGVPGPAFLSDPPKAPGHRPCHPCMHGHNF